MYDGQPGERGEPSLEHRADLEVVGDVDVFRSAHGHTWVRGGHDSYSEWSAQTELLGVVSLPVRSNDTGSFSYRTAKALEGSA